MKDNSLISKENKLRNSREKINARARRWRKNNPEKCFNYDLKRKLKKHGLTIVDYNKLFAEQSGKCKICGRTQNMVMDSLSRLSIDHDHNSGKVRGLLCQNCNIGISLFNDNPELIKAAINYLVSCENTQ